MSKDKSSYKPRRQTPEEKAFEREYRMEAKGPLVVSPDQIGSWLQKAWPKIIDWFRQPHTVARSSQLMSNRLGSDVAIDRKNAQLTYSDTSLVLQFTDPDLHYHLPGLQDQINYKGTLLNTHFDRKSLTLTITHPDMTGLQILALLARGINVANSIGGKPPSGGKSRSTTGGR